MSEVFRVGLSQHLRRPDGTPVIAELDTSPLDSHPGIEVQVLPRRGHPGPDLLRHHDAVVLMLESVDASIFHPASGLAGHATRF